MKHKHITTFSTNTHTHTHTLWPLEMVSHGLICCCYCCCSSAHLCPLFLGRPRTRWKVRGRISHRLERCQESAECINLLLCLLVKCMHASTVCFTGVSQDVHSSNCLLPLVNYRKDVIYAPCAPATTRQLLLLLQRLLPSSICLFIFTLLVD